MAIAPIVRGGLTMLLSISASLKQEQIKAIQEYAAKQLSFTVTLGKTHVFPPSIISGNAAVVAIAESPELHHINKELEEVAKFKPSDFPEYHPHVTLAFVKPEVAAKYEGLSWVEGVSFKVNGITISGE